MKPKKEKVKNAVRQTIYNVETGEALTLWPVDAREILAKNKEWSAQPPAPKEEAVIEEAKQEESEEDSKPKRGRPPVKKE
jgi:stringent starvation protein B